jgi:hypothetical protein
VLRRKVLIREQANKQTKGAMQCNAMQCNAMQCDAPTGSAVIA